MERKNLENIASQIVNCSFVVHKTLGPGLLESVYQVCLLDELQERGILVSPEFEVPLVYKGKRLEKNLRLDILVENEIIIEVKAVEGILPVHQAQIISYLKLSNKKLGFLINFNVPTIKEGIRRFVNGL